MKPIVAIAITVVAALAAAGCHAGNKPADPVASAIALHPATHDVLTTVDSLGLLKSSADVDRWAGYLQTLCTTMPMTEGTPHAMTPASLQREAHRFVGADITTDQASTILSAERRQCGS